MKLSIYRLVNTVDTDQRGSVRAMVVIASDTARARHLAYCGAVTELPTHRPEPQEAFLNEATSTIVRLGTAAEEHVEGVQVVDYDRDYNAVQYPWDNA